MTIVPFKPYVNPEAAALHDQSEWLFKLAEIAQQVGWPDTQDRLIALAIDTFNDARARENLHKVGKFLGAHAYVPKGGDAA